MHLNSRRIFELHARPLFRSGMRVLEIAPDGNRTLFHAVGDPSITWESINLIPTDASYHIGRDGLTHVTTDAYRYPLAVDSYDVVASANVMEHIRKPWLWMRELVRVCKRGGRVVTVVPLNWGYHPEPIDCWRAFPDGIAALYEDAGLEVELARCESVVGLRSRLDVAGLKYLVKRVIRRPLKGQPFLASDTICIGRKP
jgi:SAM-dependent methyltransferase